ncbi:MAG TPA: hypothetical protein VLF59_04490 [Candidatus Saccharimonadales bacterium]|nr:hypothetical protein [Candidatus Saccharimonadales bacterium]
MPEVFPDDGDISIVALDWFRHFSRPCLLAGLTLVAETGNPTAAEHGFVVEEHFDIESERARTGDAAVPVTLHCASKALLQCHVAIEGIAENPLQTGRSPQVASFDRRKLGTIACPHRARLEAWGRILPAAPENTDGTDI